MKQVSLYHVLPFLYTVKKIESMQSGPTDVGQLCKPADLPTARRVRITLHWHF